MNETESLAPLLVVSHAARGWLAGMEMPVSETIASQVAEMGVATDRQTRARPEELRERVATDPHASPRGRHIRRAPLPCSCSSPARRGRRGTT